MRAKKIKTKGNGRKRRTARVLEKEETAKKRESFEVSGADRKISTEREPREGVFGKGKHFNYFCQA